MHPEIFAKLYPGGDDGLPADENKHQTRGGKGLLNQDKAESETAEGTEGAEGESPKPQKGKKKPDAQLITIKRVDRNKRKCITAINGLEKHGVDLKKTAKVFAGKFACGSSVTKNNQNQDEIHIQGDVNEAVEKLILQMFPQIPVESVKLVASKAK